MDDIEALLTSISQKIIESSTSDTEKADIFAQLSVGMRRLIWPILLSHVPQYLLDEAVHEKTLTMDRYADLIESALANPAAPREIHDELLEALKEVSVLLTSRLPAASGT